MKSQSKFSFTPLSRRSVLLQGAVCAAGAATLIVAATNSATAAKLPKASAGYQATPKGSQECGNCALFEPPNACKSVAGEISPKGWCTLYRKA